MWLIGGGAAASHGLCGGDLVSRGELRGISPGESEITEQQGRHFLRGMEVAEAAAATAQTSWLAESAETILWPNRKDVRKLWATRTYSPLTIHGNLRWTI